MVRNRKPSSRVRTSEEETLRAVQAVIDKKMSLRTAADNYEMKKTTLARAVIKQRRNVAAGDGTLITFQPNYSHQIIFTKDEERMLEEYILNASKRHYGMTKLMVRQFAYEYTDHLCKTFPAAWTQAKMAGMYNPFQHHLLDLGSFSEFLCPCLLWCNKRMRKILQTKQHPLFRNNCSGSGQQD